MFHFKNYNNYEDYILDMKDWDIDARKLDKGDFWGTLSLIDCQTVNVIRFNFNSTIDRYGSSPEGYVSFVIPGKRDQSSLWLNKEIDSGIIAKFSDSRELDMFSKDDFSSIGLNIESKHFSRLIEHYQFQKLQKILRKEDQTFQLSKFEVMHLANYIHGLHSSLEENPRLINSTDFIYKVQFLLPYLLMELLDKSSNNGHKKILSKGDLVLQEMVSHINRNIYNKITVTNLSKIGGVSERTLTNTFKQKFGLTPLMYINRTKFNLIRRELSNHAKSETIRSIARRYGIRHFGQFSKDYYNFFSELPSDTQKMKPAEQ